MRNIITLNEFILDKQEEFQYASGDLTRLLNDIGIAAKIINSENSTIVDVFEKKITKLE